jgi:protoporphyrinogen oxidase
MTKITNFVWKPVDDCIISEVDETGTVQAVYTHDPVAKVVTTADGQKFKYEYLLSTVPLPQLAGMLGHPMQMNAVTSLRFTRTHIVGIGLRGQPPESLATQCWSYFPQSDIPFYRLTVLSNLSQGCVPEAGCTWSLMAEIAEPHGQVVAKDGVIRSVTASLRSLQLINENDVISRWHRRLEFGYPVPTRNRDCILRGLGHFLESQGIFSRGRFGAWIYEISNQDRSFMQGVELVNRLAGLGHEVTLQSALPARGTQEIEILEVNPENLVREVVPFVLPELSVIRKDKHG